MELVATVLHLNSVALGQSLMLLATSLPSDEGHKESGPIPWGRPTAANHVEPSKSVPFSHTARVLHTTATKTNKRIWGHTYKRGPWATSTTPETARKAFMSTTMTGLQKTERWCTWHCNRHIFPTLPRRWHASLGRQWKRNAPLSISHCQHVRARTVSDMPSGQLQKPIITRLCDGVGAYDHVYRAAMMEKLHQVPSLQRLLPFVRATHASSTSYVWEDEDGVQHRIVQAEEGE